jgi:hypothetical protein
MKKVNIYFLFLITLNLQAQFPSNLKAYFTFNNTLNDSTGQSSPGINNGALTAIDRWGINNRAYEFNGSGNNIDLGANLNFGITTIAFWFKPNSTSIEQFMLSNLSNANQIQTSQIEVRVTNTSKIKVLVGNVYMAPANWREFTTQATFNSTKWNHVAVVINNNFTNIKIYINGVLDTDSPINGLTYTQCTGTMRLGTRSNPTSEGPYNGKIDEVMIFNKALNDAEVKLVFGLTNGITSTSNDFNFRLLQNPIKSNDPIQIQIAHSKLEYNLVITDEKSTIIPYTVTKNSDILTVNIIELPAGIYYLHFATYNSTLTRKFVVM